MPAWLQKFRFPCSIEHQHALETSLCSLANCFWKLSPIIISFWRVMMREPVMNSQIFSWVWSWKSPSFPPGDPPSSYFVVPYHFPWWFQVLVPSIFLGVSWGSPAPELWDIPAPVLSSSNLWPALGKPEPSLRDSWKIALCEMSWKSCPIWFEVEHTHNFLIGS